MRAGWHDRHRTDRPTGAIRKVRDRLAEEEAQLAVRMRLHGSTWQQVADTFAISRQGAHERFSRSAKLLHKVRGVIED